MKILNNLFPFSRKYKSPLFDQNLSSMNFAEERERERDFRFTIAWKIAFTFLIILLLMAVIFWIILRLNNIVNKNHAAIEEEASKQGAAGNLRFSIAQLIMFPNDYIITEKDDYRRRFELQRVQVDDYEKKLRAFKLSSEELAFIDSISADIDSIYAYAYRIFVIPRPRSSPEAAALMETIDYTFGDAVNRKTTEIFNIVFRKIEEHRIQSMRAKEQMLNTIYTVLLLGLVVSSIVVYLSVQKIAKPIRTLVKAADSIAKGDYSQRPVVSTRDEIGLLSRSFSRMAEEIELTHRNLEARKRFTENIVTTVPSGLIAIGKPARLSGSGGSGGESEVTALNRSFCELFDVRQQDAMGKNIDAVLQTIGLSEECRDAIAERMPFSNLECVCSIPGKGELTLNLTLTRIRVAEEEEEEEESLLVIDNITDRKRAEETLRKSEERFRGLIEHASDGIFIADPSGKYIEVNSSGCAMLGYTRDEILQKTIQDLVRIPSDKPLRLEELRQGKTIISEREMIRKDGSLMPVEISAKLLPDGNLQGIVRDITERKRTKAELLKIGTAIEQSADCTVITDKDGIIQYVNPAFTQIYGYTIEEALGKTPRILKSGFHPQMFYEGLWRTILSGNVFQATFLNKKKDGEIIYILKTITPIKDKYDNVIYFIDTGKDITEQRKAERNLKQSEERFRNIYENLTVGIYRTTPDGKVLMANPTMLAILGFDSLEDYQKVNVQAIHIDKSIRDKFKEIIQEEGYVYGFEYEAKRKDGRIIYVRESAKAYRNDPLDKNKGDIAYFEGALEDITEKKQAEKELIAAKELAEQSTKLKDAFIANISHEIRTPLHGILGMTSLIKELYYQHITEEDKELFTGITDSSNRIIRTVDMILNYSRLQTGEFPISPKKTELSTICESLVRECKSAAKMKSLELSFEDRCKDSTILADEYSITQAISNLIDNAIKYTKKGFVSLILSEGNNDDIILKVKDSGIGFSKEFLKHIFEPYRQEDMRYGRAYEGVGLGLSLVKKFLDLNNAIITVKSKKGEGTTFTIIFSTQGSPESFSVQRILRKGTFPKDRSDAAWLQGKIIKRTEEKTGSEKIVGTISTAVFDEPRQSRESKSDDLGISSAEPLEKKKDRLVLLVEDDEINQAVIKRFLESRFNTLITESSDEVIEILKNNKVDIILMDISIKGTKNGLELTKELKASKEYKHIPVIAVTAHAFDKDRQNSLDAGCDDYISKPFKAKELLDNIIRLIEKR